MTTAKCRSACSRRPCCCPACRSGLGPTGVRGPTGPSATGPTGATGVTGFGATGPTGPCCSGPTGARGPTGFAATGPTGPCCTGPTGAGTVDQPGSRVFGPGVLVTHGTPVILEYTTEQWTTGDAVFTPPSALTAPVDGKYLIIGQATFFTEETDADVQIRILLNGTIPIAAQNVFIGADSIAHLNVSTIYELEEGEFVVLEASVISDPGDVAVVTSTPQISPEFMMYRLGA